MATLTIEKGASPQIGQKQVTNYNYVMTGDNTQDVEYVYPETDVSIIPSDMLIPDPYEFAPTGRINLDTYWENDVSQGITLTDNIQPRVINAGTPYQDTVNELRSVSARYYDGTFAGYFTPKGPENAQDYDLVIITESIPIYFRMTLTNNEHGYIIMDGNNEPTDDVKWYSVYNSPITVKYKANIYEKLWYWDSVQQKYIDYYNGIGSIEYERTGGEPNFVIPTYGYSSAKTKDHTSYNCELTLQEVVT